MKKLILLPLLLLLISCNNSVKKTPLGWCIWEIQTHEGYENCAYTYQEVYANDLQKEASMGGKYYAYIITTYSYPMRTEWFCEIECKKTSSKYVSEEEVYVIDCDVLYEVCYE